VHRPAPGTGVEELPHPRIPASTWPSFPLKAANPSCSRSTPPSIHVIVSHDSDATSKISAGAGSCRTLIGGDCSAYTASLFEPAWVMERNLCQLLSWW
jgi:hypothetical protein